MTSTHIEPGSPCSSSSAPIYPSESITTPIRTRRERQFSRNSRPPLSGEQSPTASPSLTIASSSYDTLLHQRSTSSKSSLALPLFSSKETTSTPHSPCPKVLNISRQSSLQESASLSPSKREHSLPSHHLPRTSSPRGRLFSSPGMSVADNITRRGEEGSPHGRRWSSNITGNHRVSTNLAHRLAEGASPYLRAGLDELRSIFDVDSDPIPISAIDEDDSNDDEEMSRRDRRQSISIDLASSSSKYPPASESPASKESRTSSLDESVGSGLGLYRASSLSSRSVKSLSQSVNEVVEKAPLRAEDGTMDVGFSAAGLGINRGILAWCLALIATGMTGLCAYGYAIHSDTFSTTLIGFFLTQPAFSLMGLIALLMRRRALMDLFSRAMRAHVLAQACIVLLAYLDLSASSLYVSSANSLRSSTRVPFRMVPTMEMRFGPSRGAIEAGDTPGINLLYSKASRSGADGLSLSSEGSAHSHDTHVGDFQSRLTHLIVFLVQAAFPIVAILIGQYLVAQRLAWLARRTSAVSRQNSCSVKSKADRSSPEVMRRSTTLPSRQNSSGAERQLTAQLHSSLGPLNVSSSHQPGAKHSKHARSLSQPLDFLTNDSMTSKSTNKNSTEDPKSFLSLPLSESPPVED